jgi:hypothetical protein
MKEKIVQFLRELLLIQQSQPGKIFYQSKRFWSAVLSLAVILIQTQTGLGWLVDPEIQMLALTGVNFVVGLLTKSPTGFAWDEGEDRDQGSGARGQGGDAHLLDILTQADAGVGLLDRQRPG